MCPESALTQRPACVEDIEDIGLSRRPVPDWGNFGGPLPSPLVPTSIVKFGKYTTQVRTLLVFVMMVCLSQPQEVPRLIVHYARSPASAGSLDCHGCSIFSL